MCRDRTGPGDRHASDQRDPELELRSAEEINERPDDGGAVRRRWSYNGKQPEPTRRKKWGGSCGAEEKNLRGGEKMFPRANTFRNRRKHFGSDSFFAEDLSNYELKMSFFFLITFQLCPCITYIKNEIFHHWFLYNSGNENRCFFISYVIILV